VTRTALLHIRQLVNLLYIVTKAADSLSFAQTRSNLIVTRTLHTIYSLTVDRIRRELSSLNHTN
jgi:hypothetical protein